MLIGTVHKGPRGGLLPEREAGTDLKVTGKETRERRVERCRKKGSRRNSVTRSVLLLVSRSSMTSEIVERDVVVYRNNLEIR